MSGTQTTSGRRGLSGRAKALIIVLGVLVVAGVVTVVVVLFRPTAEAGREAAPTVVFDSPGSGDTLPLGRPVVVHAVAQGGVPIARVEVWVDGALEASTDAALPDGVSPLPVMTYWTPVEAGAHVLVARAFDADDGRSEAAIAVEVTSGDDRDGDGVADAVDACPDEAGWASAGGCPDRDGDGVADAADACPDEAGAAGSGGCPAPSGTDRDGDGTSDDGDVCPDAPGAPGTDGCAWPGDRDGDETTDDVDACPDEPGAAETGGCPDRDGDGVIDGADACPDVAGPPESGCPAPGEGDRDGDGLPDADDACPDEPGPAGAGGCPGAGPAGAGEDDDSDGDGVPDAADSCPGAPGAADMEGCPDSDGDGVPEYRDMCPDEAGVAESLGCPVAEVRDSDGDGVTEPFDRCPEDPGAPEDLGCPPPGDDEAESLVPLDDSVMEARRIVEFLALGFEVSDAYDGVYCYPSLAGGPVERYSLDPAADQHWSLAPDLGSQTLLVDADEPLSVQMECGGDVVYSEGDSGWGTYWGIGSIAESHPSSDWDGHVITVRSTGGDEGRWFEVTYALCAGSCRDAAFPAPAASLDDGVLTWQWDGDLDDLGAYRVLVDGSRVALFRGTGASGAMDVSAYTATCGSRHTAAVVAVGRDGRESLRSNPVLLAAEPCPRVLRVTFDSLTTFDLGNDQGESTVGPIFGSFFASSSTRETLSFNGVDYGEWWGERNHGYRLASTHYYPVQSIFDQIWTWIGGSMSSPYSAPDRNYVTIELGPGDDLVFGAAILDEDDGTNPTDTLFDARRTIRAEDIRPGRYRLSDRNIELAVLIDVIVGPEVGREPDLTITAVEKADDGALQVHVFNNAAGMTVPADLVVEWADIATGEVRDRRTFPDVQVPSGGSRILTTGADVGEIGGMRFVLDPDEDVADGNRANNSFDTPVTMRVEFLDVAEGHCSETGCSIFDCDREWSYAFWAGHGPSASDVAWVAHNVRFPSSGELTACTHDICEWRASPDEDWSAAGDPRFTFEFEMPATEALYVMATGTEHDVWTDDDPFATPVVAYSAGDGWGARSEPYEVTLEVRRACDDALCADCHDNNGGSVTWRISRVG